MSEAKPTPGPWRADGEEVCSDSVSCIAYCCAAAPFAGWSGTDFSGESFREANARLIADAGTIYHQTGLTPSQLVERVKELEDCLDRMQKSMRRQIDLIAERAPGDFLNKRSVVQTMTMHEARARAALAKSTSIGDTQCKTTN